MKNEECSMQGTVSRNEIEELKGAWQRLDDAVAQASARPQISDAVLTLIAAINYEDEALLHSSFASLLAALAGLTRDSITRELGAWEAVTAGLKEGWQKYLNTKAYEIAVFDELRDKIESIIDERMAGMLKLRKAVSSLAEHEQQVENAQALEDSIRELRRFREDILKGWPSRKPPSPIDRKAIAEAREAIARGEKGLAEGDRRHTFEFHVDDTTADTHLFVLGVVHSIE